MQKALDKKRDLKHRRKRVISKRNDLQKAALEKDHSYVKVRETCYSDVTTKIKEYRIFVSKERTHVKFFDDPKAMDIGISSY
jgi:galactitol-specific phosphotransferase system IIB component